MIREHGLGNGYGALMASGSVLMLIGPILRDPLEIAATVGLADLNGLVTAIAIAAAIACVLRWRIAARHANRRSGSRSRASRRSAMPVGW